MNQKKLITMCCLAMLTLANAKAQEVTKESRFYLRAGGGYFLSVSNGQFPNVGPYPPQDNSYTVSPTTGVQTLIREKVLTGSFGEGARGEIGGGYNFNKYIAVELAFHYYRSVRNLMTRRILTFEGTNTLAGSLESKGDVRAIDLAPSLVLNPGFRKWNPYMRFGCVFPLYGRLRITTNAFQTSRVTGFPANILAFTNIYRYEEVKPYPTIGFQGAMGITLCLNRHAQIFLETEYRNVPVKSQSKKVTKYNEVTQIINTTTGQEVAPQQTRGLNDLSVAERYTDYVTTLDQTSNTAIGTSGTTTLYKDNNKPSNDLISYINIGGLGFNIGFKINL